MRARERTRARNRKGKRERERKKKVGEILFLNRPGRNEKSAKY
jgi:hypothetical protein